ncbi:MAG: cobaltochelatase subunit CobN [Deltaproteobacteria bacterium]|nr:cobaltochelatase subunit CobN [Deltaproteobacteria bacterium]
MKDVKKQGESRPLFIIQSVGGDEEAVLLAKEHGDATEGNLYQRINEYFTKGGTENFSKLLQYLHSICFDTGKEVPPPALIQCQGIYHPEIFGPMDLNTWESKIKIPGRPTIGIWFYQGFWLNRNLAHVNALIAEVEKQGANALAVFSYRLKDVALGNLGADDISATYFTRDGKPVMDALVSLMGMSMRITQPEYANVLPVLNVPYLQGLVSSSPFAVWKDSDKGVSTMDVTFQAAQPEFDGALITVPVATREEDEVCPVTGAMLSHNVPIPERTAKLVSLARNWAQLRHTSNNQKRVAIIFHHYPPRNDRIGCAAGLDSFASVKHLIDALQKIGYLIEDTYEDGDDLANRLLEKMTCDRRYLTPDKMAARAQVQMERELFDGFHKQFPESVRTKTTADWGTPPGDLFVHDDRLLMPGIMNGNVFISIQPPRGYFENPEAILHDLHLSPPHHYLAYYWYIRHVFKANAVIHVGKHGSLEWLPGKALGLSDACYPDLAIQDLPNIYPYIINDPSEGTQAKRRSYCAIVDHLTPVFTNADLYEEMIDVDKLLTEIKDAERQDPGKLTVLRPMLYEAVVKADLHEDLSITEQDALENTDAVVGKLHAYLSELSDNMINDGLHTLGQSPKGSQLVELVVQMTRHENGDVPSLRESVAAAFGYNYDDALNQRGETFPGSNGLTGGEIIRQTHELCLKLVAFLEENSFNVFSPGNAELLLRPDIIGQFAEQELRVPGLGNNIPRVLNYICNTLVPNIRRVTDEIDATLNGLNGGFVVPGPSGAPTRGQADILPTGRNFFSVDPRVIPSKSAWEVGVRLGDALLERYKDETGEYPQSVGMIVYGGNTMRTKGDDIAEILYLLGLRPVWDQNGIVKGLEVIPHKQLKRPRIDVMPRISGFFRDAFSLLVELIDDAVNMVATLLEPQEINFIRAHVEKDASEYKKAGKSDLEARALASIRVFGCPPGTYGAGVAELVESRQWETKEDLASNYIRYSAHAYSRNSYGTVQKDAFKKMLGRMDATVKNEDSREYDIYSCTDFYNYYGGLIAAGETVRGIAPKSYVGDSADPKRVGLRSVAEETKFILRSRLLNPKWLEGMKRHGYKGAGDISKVMDIIIGWDATADVMEDWMYDRVAKTYALDADMQKWLKEVNPHALLNITEKLLETIQRGMWQTDEVTEEHLRQTYLEIEGDIEDSID